MSRRNCRRVKLRQCKLLPLQAEDTRGDEFRIHSTSVRETLAAAWADRRRGVLDDPRGRSVFGSPTVFPIIPVWFYFLGRNQCRVPRALDVAASDRGRLGPRHPPRTRGCHPDAALDAAPV